MGRSIAIVGNGDIDPALGPTIDAADLVIRFNDCRSAGPGGRKTDIVAVCNTGRPARKMLHEPGWKDNPSVMQASEIWCVRDPQKFAAMRAPLMLSHPELDDFCDDYTEEFRQFAASTGKALHIIPATIHEALDRTLATFSPPPHVVPSSGAVLIAELLARFALRTDHIFLAGFGHAGWEWHPWGAERQWIDGLIADGKLSRLAAPVPPPVEASKPFLTSQSP